MPSVREKSGKRGTARHTRHKRHTKGGDMAGAGATANRSAIRSTVSVICARSAHP